MMAQAIIYKQDNGHIAAILPTPDALAKYGIEAIALKDVPAGKPFKIIDQADIPAGSDFDAWTCDDSELTDGVGADWDVF
jgi:hypothetical protein